VLVVIVLCFLRLPGFFLIFPCGSPRLELAVTGDDFP